MRSLRRPTRLVPSHNPTAELLRIIFRNVKAIVLRRKRKNFKQNQL